MNCQEEKQMLHFICSLFQGSQQSSCAAPEPDSSSSAFSHPWLVQTPPKKEKTIKEEEWHTKVEGGLSEQHWFCLCVREEGFSCRNSSHRRGVSCDAEGEWDGLSTWELEDIRGHQNTLKHCPCRQPYPGQLQEQGLITSGKIPQHRKTMETPPASQISHLVMWKNEDFLVKQAPSSKVTQEYLFQWKSMTLPIPIHFCQNGIPVFLFF